MEDIINNPKHHTAGGIETIDFMAAKLSRSEFVGYLKGNIIKYLARANFKGKHDEDLQKAKWYQDKLSSILNTSYLAPIEVNETDWATKIKPYKEGR